MLDWTLLPTVFGVIFVAQLPGKSALASLVLATRSRPWPVFLGSVLALAIHSVFAVAGGGLLSRLPARPVHIGAGIVFLAVAAFMWLRNEGGKQPEDESEPPKQNVTFARAFTSAVGVVFVAEWGDLTQLATAAFAARYGEPTTVWLGATAALSAVAAVATFVGSRAGSLLNPEVTNKVAAVIFAALGAALAAGIL